MTNFGIYGLVLLGTLAMSAMGVTKRLALKDQEFSPLTFLTGYYVAASFIFAAVYLLLWGFSWPALAPGFWTAVFITSAMNVAIQLLNARAASLAAGDVSLTAPLQALTPGLITIVALTLGELPGRIGAAGIGIMMLGSYTLLMEPNERFTFRGLIRPFKTLTLLLRWKELQPKEKDWATVVVMSLTAAAFSTVGLLFDGLYVRRGNNIQGLTLGACTFTGVLALTYYIWRLVSPDYSKSQARGKDLLLSGKYWLVILVAGIAWVLHIYGIYPGYRVSYIAYVATLKRVSIVITALIGWLFFHEQHVKKRLFAAILIVLGALLLASDNLPAKISNKIEGFGL